MDLVSYLSSQGWKRALYRSLSALYYSVLFLALAAVMSGCAGMPMSQSPQNKGLLQLNQKDKARLSQWDYRSKNSHRPEIGVPYGRRPSSEGYIWPVEHGFVSSFFGRRERSFHDGIDIRNQAGTPIFAARSGRVIYSDRKVRGYGNMVIIRHDDRYATVYAHNRKNLVRRGEFVKQGQLIGLVGSTGHASGPHLHFEVRYLEMAQDPLNFLPRSSNSAIAKK